MPLPPERPSYDPLSYPTPLGCQSTRFELHASYSNSPLATCFKNGNVYVPKLLSRSIPPSPSPAASPSLFSMSVSLFLPCEWAHQYHFPFCCHLVAESCPTFCDPVDYSLPGSSVHGISQARRLEWVAISISRGSS